MTNEVKSSLYPHQERGVSWMLEREKCEKCPGGILMDECGLGKTVQVIETLKQNPQPVTMIVCPVTILKQWVSELHHWAPEFKVILYHKSKLRGDEKGIHLLYKHAKTAVEALSTNTNVISQKLDKVTLNVLTTHKSHTLSSPFIKKVKLAPTTQTTKKIQTEKKLAKRLTPLVVVTSYGKLVNAEFEKVRKRLKTMGALEGAARHATGQTFLNQIKWDRVVLDECHLIRNFGTTRTRYVLALQSTIKWCLTATPIHNGMEDYLCLLRFLGFNKWETAQILGSHPVLEKYLSKQAQEMVKGRTIDFSSSTTTKVTSKRKPFLSHDDLSLRRTKKQVFSNKRFRENDEEKEEKSRKKQKNSNMQESKDGEKFKDEEEKFKDEEQKSRNKENSGPFLPDLLVDVVHVDFNTLAEENMYRRLERLIMLELFPVNGDEALDRTDQEVFERILRLRQATVNPQLVLAGYKRKFGGRIPINLFPDDGPEYNEQLALVNEEELVREEGVRMTRLRLRNSQVLQKERRLKEDIGIPSKTRALCDMIREHRDEKAIVFCEYREEMSHLQQDMHRSGISSCLYDGSLSLTQREALVKRMSWTNAAIYDLLSSGLFFPGVTHVSGEIVDLIAQYVSYDVVIVQINSGNAGLNLQMCSRVYFTNINWNPCTEIQAISRAHRCGQLTEVKAVKLVLSGVSADKSGTVRKTIDQRVLEVQKQKREVMADILGDEDILFNGNDCFFNNNVTELLKTKTNSLTRDEMVFLITGSE